MPAKRSDRIVIDGTIMSWGRAKKTWLDPPGGRMKRKALIFCTSTRLEIIVNKA